MRTHKTSRIIAGIAVIGAVAAGGAAYTAGITLTPESAGYGTVAVSGAAISTLDYTLRDGGANIDAAILTTTTDLDTGKDVTAGFDPAGVGDEDCVVSGTTSPWTITCTFVADVATDDADNFHLAVVNTP